MNNLNLTTKTWICLRNKKTLKYFRFEENSEMPLMTADALGTPPSISVGDQGDNSAQLKIVLVGKVDEEQPLSYGSRVHLVTSNNQYLACLADGGLRFDKLGLGTGLNKTLIATSTWILTDRSNNIIKKPITVYDDVVFKSMLSTYLACNNEGWVTTESNTITTQSIWNIMKADVPYIPDWVYLRQPLAKNMTLTADLSTHQITKKEDKKPLSSFPLQIQEWLLIEDILDIMLGFEGVYIKKRGDKANFVIESHFETASCDVSVNQLCQKILLVATQQYFIENYIAAHSFECGIVAQAFCGALTQLLKQYKNMVISLDSQAGTRGLTLQMLWSYIQPSASVISALCLLTKSAFKLRGGALLTCIYNFMMSSTQQMISSIYKILFQKAILVFIQQLQNWIYSGKILDKHREFMIERYEITKDKRVNEWNEKYGINREMVPSFMGKEAELVLKIGKYLNVIMECDKSMQNPYKNEISRNLERFLVNNDFSEAIRNSYKWVSEKLMNFMFKDKALTTVLLSLKGFFLVDYGDVYTNFLEAAENELCEARIKSIPTEKFQSLLDISIKTSTSKNDIFSEDILCRIQNLSLFQHVNSIKRMEQDKFNFDPQYRPPGQSNPSKYFQSFVFDCKIEFPLNLIINYQCLNKYQVLFRHLFWFKYIERYLNDAWLVLQSVKEYEIECIGRAHLLLQRMIHYVRSMMYYLFYEVIERNWAVLMENLKKTNTFEDIMLHHDNFLDRCLKESMITNEKLLKVILYDLGNTIQGFVQVKKYLSSLSSDIESSVQQRRVIDQQNKAERGRTRNQLLKARKAKAEELIQKSTLGHVIEGMTLSFDKAMKLFLEDLYRVLAKDKDRESMENLIYLLPRLDTHDYYDKRLEIHKTDRRMYE